MAAVALPQYQIAVEKARVMQVLPLIKNMYDALALYKLEHGDYSASNFEDLVADEPNGFETYNTLEFDNDQWYCFPNEEGTGYSYCDNKQHAYLIVMVQPDDEPYSAFAGKRICVSRDEFGIRLCKALGGKELDDKFWGHRSFEF